MSECPATREAVEEQEEVGEVGCPICGRPASAHPTESDAATDEAEREWIKPLPEGIP